MSDDSFFDDLIGKSNKGNKLVNNLYKIPKKDKGLNVPHHQATIPNLIHQADLIFLPNDNGFKYALVVVDIATRKVDAIPLKSKTNTEILSVL